jgi:hypothetical protein
LRRKLRLGNDVPFVRATAVRGHGVKPTLALAMKLGVEAIDSEEVAAMLPALQNADALFDHVLTFEDDPARDEPLEVEELNLDSDVSDLSPEAVAAHLSVSSLDSLEKKAARAAQRKDREGATTTRFKAG